MLAEYWDVSLSQVNALSGVYMYVFVPMNIVSMWLVVNYLGLGRGLQVGALLNMMGALVMYAGGQPGWFILSNLSIYTDYERKYLGTFLCALAQAFLLPMVALLSANWFGETERATATSLGSLAFQLGSLFGLGSTAVVDFHLQSTETLDPVKLDGYMKVQWIVSFVALVLALLVLKDRPPTPPSEAAATLVQNQALSIKYLDSIRMILCSPSSTNFFFLFGLVIGTFYAIPAFFSQFMPTWSSRMQGTLGGIFQVAAVLGCLAAGQFVLWWNMQYKKISLFLLAGCLVSSVLYLISVQFQSYLAVLACSGMGFFFSSFMAVGIEFGTSLTFPADEAAVYGILDSTGELSGFLLLTLGGALSEHHWEVLYCIVLAVLLAFSLFLLWRLDPFIRRPSFMTSESFVSRESSVAFV